MGRIVSTLSLTRLQKYSLFQKYRARSATFTLISQKITDHGKFCAYLEVRARDGFCELLEQRLLNLGELGGIHDFEDILDFVEEHDFFGAVDLGPISEKAEHNLEYVN